MPDSEGLDGMTHINGAEKANLQRQNPGEWLPEQRRKQRLNAKGQEGNFGGDGSGSRSKL